MPPELAAAIIPMLAAGDIDVGGRARPVRDNRPKT